MEKLPIELFDEVLLYFDNIDYYNCLQVSKLWFNVFTPILYSSIKPESEYQLHLFLASMTRHPKYAEYGYYIKELYLNYMENSDTYKIITNNKLLIIDVLSRCPNLERMAVGFFEDTVQGLVGDDMPVLKHLKHFEYIQPSWPPWHQNKYKTSEVVLKAFHKFRNTLTKLDLEFTSEALNNFQLINLSTYLQSFRSLTDLRIVVPSSLEKSPVFDTVFSDCPHLTNVYFCGFRLNGQKHNILPYPTLKQLHLEMTYFDVQYIYYITRKFTCLSDLTFTYDHGLEKNIKILCHNMFSMNSLGKLLLMQRGQPGNSFCQSTKYMMQFPLIGTSNKILLSASGIHKLMSSFEYNKFTRTRTLRIHVSNNNLGIVNYESALAIPGPYIDRVEVHNKHFFPSVNRERFNQIFPKLSELYLGNSSSATGTEVLTRCYTLRTLDLDRVTIGQSLFDDIRYAYPSLQNLILKLNSKNMNITNFYPGTLELPKTGLKSLTIDCTTALRRSFVVLRAVGDTIVRAWSYDHGTLKVTVTEHEEALAVSQKRNVKKIFFLKSSTIEDVTFLNSKMLS
ncbi:hypothetical protein BDB01DRAFT_809997 [Pilobolus umbonatus]|nr:hypothetical protein BDB01DRAFT_809997 [Pilobolus umbonatus]